MVTCEMCRKELEPYRAANLPCRKCRDVMAVCFLCAGGEAYQRLNNALEVHEATCSLSDLELARLKKELSDGQG